MALQTALELLRRSSGLPLREERDVTLKEPADWLWEALGGPLTATGQRVTVGSALGIIPVLSAVRLIAESVASLPMVVYRATATARERARDTNQWALLHVKPAPEMPANQLYELVAGDLNLWGNAYLEKVRVGGVLRELWRISPDGVEVSRDGDGRKQFKVKGNDGVYGTDTVLHIPAYGYDGITGLSPLAIHRQALGTAQAREEYEGRYYGNDATPGGYLSHPSQLSPEAADRLKAKWDALHRGTKNAFRTAVLEEGMTWSSTSIPLQDQQFIEGHRFTVGQIARMFRVPPEMIGGDSGGSLTYSTVEGQALHFVKFSLAHWLTRIEGALHADDDLFPDKSIYPEFLVEGLLRGDSSSRADFYEKLKNIGVLSPNEIRERENLPPREGGDEYQDTTPGAPPNAPAAPQDGSGGSNGTRAHPPLQIPLRTPQLEGSLS